MNAKNVRERMSATQREMVRRNLGLVGMQIKRLLGGRIPPGGAGEYWDELFQEGVLGLIQAVTTYDPNRGLAFATWAVPRIRYASWRALQRYRELIRLPERHSRRRSKADAGHASDPYQPPDRPPASNCPGGDPANAETAERADPHRAAGSRRRRSAKKRIRGAAGDPPPPPAHVRMMTPEQLANLPARLPAGDAPSGLAGDAVETIGAVLRQRIEAAVDRIVESLAASRDGRGDRGELARAVADQRLMVPAEEYRASLRQIARETGSSYGRVVACEGRLLAELRKALAADVEVELLCRSEDYRRAGLSAVVDDRLRRAVRHGVGEHVVQRFEGLPRAERAELLITVLEGAGVGLGGVLRASLSRLSDATQAELAGRIPAASAPSPPGEGSPVTWPI